MTCRSYQTRIRGPWLSITLHAAGVDTKGLNEPQKMWPITIHYVNPDQVLDDEPSLLI